MASESSFWAIELTKGNPESTWPGESVVDDEAEEAAEHILEVERACLGASAKANDLNVVTVHTFINDGESTVATPIARLKVNGKEQCRIGLQFSSQVTFKLTSGNGPVHLMGLKETMYDDDMDSDDEMIDDGEMDSEEEENMLKAVPAVAAKKRPASGGIAPPAKKNQRTVSMPGDEEDSEDDSEDDSDDALDLMARPADSDDDEDDSEDEDMDDDDFDEDDDDDEDDDEDDDDDDEEDSDDEPPKLVKAGKPQQQKGKGPQKPQQQQKGGKAAQQPKQQQKPQQGKPAQQQKQTPQKGKQAGQAAGPPSIDAVLAKLKSSPNLPKKQDKFTNLLKNNFQVKDEKVINDLWTKVQKSRN